MPYKNIENRIKQSRKYYILNREKRIKYQRQWYKDNKIRVFKFMKENYPKYRKHQSARTTAGYKIPLSLSCNICHSKKKLQRHHWRYDKPLLVNTLCSICHHIQHAKHFEECYSGRK